MSEVASTEKEKTSADRPPPSPFVSVPPPPPLTDIPPPPPPPPLPPADEASRTASFSHSGVTAGEATATADDSLTATDSNQSGSITPLERHGHASSSPPSSSKDQARVPSTASKGEIELNKPVITYLAASQILLCCRCTLRHTSFVKHRQHTVLRGGGCPCHPLSVAEDLLRADLLLSLDLDLRRYSLAISKLATPGQWLLNSLSMRCCRQWPLISAHWIWSRRLGRQFDRAWRAAFEVDEGIAEVHTSDWPETQVELARLLGQCATGLGVDIDDLDLMFGAVSTDDVDGQVLNEADIRGRSGFAFDDGEDSFLNDYFFDDDDDEGAQADNEAEDDAEEVAVMSSGPSCPVVSDWQVVCNVIVEMAGLVSVKSVSIDCQYLCEYVFANPPVSFGREFFECNFRLWIGAIDDLIVERELRRRMRLRVERSKRLREVEEEEAKEKVEKEEKEESEECDNIWSRLFYDMRWSAVPRSLRKMLCLVASLEMNSPSSTLLTPRSPVDLKMVRANDLHNQVMDLLDIRQGSKSGKDLASILTCQTLKYSRSACCGLSFRQWLGVVLSLTLDKLSNELWLIPPALKHLEKVIVHLRLDVMLEHMETRRRSEWSRSQRRLFNDLCWLCLSQLFARGVMGLIHAVTALLIACVEMKVGYQVPEEEDEKEKEEVEMLDIWEKWFPVMARARALVTRMTAMNIDGACSIGPQGYRKLSLRRIDKQIEAYLTRTHMAEMFYEI